MVEKSFKRHIIQVLTVVLLFSCSPQKRLNRLVKKYPHLTEVSIDTIRVVDTFIVQQYDTTLINNFIKQYDTITEKIIHSVKLPNDTIIKEKIIPIEVEKIVYKEISWWEKYQSLIYIFLISFVLLVIYKRLTK